MANQPTKYRKFVVGAASAALVASAVAPAAFAAEFTDVKDDSSHKAAIDALSDAGVITGYEDGTFKPNKTLTRSDVVKLLGKWLVNAQGYKVPTDYKTNPRFTDQTAKTNDELLKYSAVVKDNGVFNGYENGSLGATNDITRENMAIVLVRAFDTVNKTDLVSYVADKTFNKDVVDRAQAKAEARPYIDVLDFFDITNPAAPNFRPKETTTRGQFASFLFNTTKVEIGDVDGTVSSIKAINSTTVEVKFNDKIEDIKSLDFAIEGLTVTNAAVKQSDNKTAVLTTSPQEGKKYTVTANGKAIGSFEGISAVIPTKIDVTSNSIQAVVGKEVTVQAKVTVPEGQSKLGIPVTFNIITQRAGLNTGAVHEVYTNADGVASYTYTQYYGGEDTVVAYPTGAPSTRSTEGKVYWGVKDQLTITEVTAGNTLANGAKKVYKVVAKDADGAALKDQLINVAFEENVNVAQDKGVTKVEVTDASNYGTNPATKYPYQYTTGGATNHDTVQIKLDKDGEATFTLSGSDASVTPIVYLDGTLVATATPPWTGDHKLGATELQAKAAKVTFAAVQNIEVAVESVGTKDAAAINMNKEGNFVTGAGDGGRDYKATIRNKNGQLAQEGTRVYVTVTKEDLKGDVQLKDAENVNKGSFNSDGTTVIPLEVGKDGVVKFTLIGSKGSHATPTVFLDNGETLANGAPNGKLDKADAQSKGEIVYFGDAVLKTATIKVKDGTGANAKEITSLTADKTAYFIFQITDQNGKANKSQRHAATFELKNTGFVNSIKAKQSGVAGETTILAEKTGSVPFTTDNGEAILEVIAEGPTTVDVDVSSSQVTLGGKIATVDFTKANVLPATYTGQARVNTTDGEITFLKSNGSLVDPYTPVSYKGAGTIFKDNNANVIDEAAFLALIAIDVTAGEHSRVTVNKDANGVYTFEYLGRGTTNLPVPPVVPTAAFQTVVATDESGDGVVDTIKLTFDNAVKDSSIALADFVVQNATVTAYSTGATANDNEIILTVTPSNEGLGFDTRPLGNLTIAAGQTIEFGNGVVLDSTIAPVVVADKVAPVLKSVGGVQNTNAKSSIEATGGNALNLEILDTDYAGAFGNEATWVITDSGAGNLVVAWVGGALQIDLGGDTPTLNQLVAAINTAVGTDIKATLPVGSNAGDIVVVDEGTFKDGSTRLTVTFSERVKNLTLNFDVLDVVGSQTEDFINGTYYYTVTEAKALIDTGVSVNATTATKDLADNTASTTAVQIQ